MKLDISVLHQRQLDWDDPIPNELKRVWEANFDVIWELGNIQFKRAIVPSLCTRFKRKNRDYSCHLIFSRTKILHDITVP